MSATDTEDISVTTFRDYIGVRTDHPNPDYEGCANFLEQLATDVGIQCSTIWVLPGKPFTVMTLLGTDPKLTSVMFYSHTDVVPAYEEFWSCDPFAAYKAENGNIYGRGTQDMKSVGIQYVEAIRRLIQSNHASFLRTIHIVFGPDEEIGGFDGMGRFVDHQFFKDMNVGFVLDEGVPWPDDVYRIYYGERCGWPIKVTITGNPGHGSRFIHNTAGEKLTKLLSILMKYREEQFSKMNSEFNGSLGYVTTINLTKIEGGVQINVIPATITAYFDIRIPPTEDFETFEEQLHSWMKEAGSGVSFEFESFMFFFCCNGEKEKHQKGHLKIIAKMSRVSNKLNKYTLRDITKVDESNPWWMSMKDSLDSL